jgi:hypothetical protein
MNATRAPTLEPLQLRLLLSADVYPPTGVAVINDDYQQRSMVTCVQVTFTEDVSPTLDKADLLIRNDTTGDDVAPEKMNLTYDALSNTAKWTFPGFPDCSLPTGYYTGTISGTSVADPAGNLLDGDGDGIGGDDLIFRFHRFPGDASGDAKVDLSDLQSIVIGIYKSGKNVPGDLNCDGRVDVGDLGILGHSYGTCLTDLQVIETLINEGSPQRSRIETLAFRFNDEVWVGPNALRLRNDNTGEEVDLLGAAFSYDAENNTGVWDLSEVPLDDACYTARLVGQRVMNLGGYTLDGNGDGIGGDDYVYQFPYLVATPLGSVYYIDRDGDGYGVASPQGPDADDTDPDVTTFQSALDKHGTLQALLAHLGYHGDRIIFVAKNGNDATAEIGNIQKPFANYYNVPGGIQPGDLFLFRQGTWQATSTALGAYKLNGTPEKPIVFLATPGEYVLMDSLSQSIGIDTSSYIIVDGFVADNTRGRYSKGIGMKFSHHITLRNIEARGHERGMIGMQDLHDILTEYCVFHDNVGSHGIYWGARDLPNSNLTVRCSIMYRNFRYGFQHNGRVTNLVLENNIIHSNNLGGISLLQGINDSFIRNNLIFNNNKQGIVINTYDDAHPNILPYDQNNILIENNLIWIGKYSWNGNYLTQDYSGILFADSTAAQASDLGHNTIRNNIIVTYQGEIFRFSQPKFAETCIIQDNLIYRVAGDDEVMYYGGAVYDFAAFTGFSDLFSGNTYAEPNFRDVSIDYYLTPEKFDFTIEE